MVGALLALLVGALALVAALFFQLGTFGRASQEDVPNAATTAPRDIAVTDLDSLFAGPQRLRAEATAVTLPITAGQEIATLKADSVYGIASFDLIGGPSAELVQQGGGTAPAGGGVGADAAVDGMVIKATEELAKRLSQAGAEQMPLLTLRVIAKDVNGNISLPANVGFRVTQAPVVTRVASGDERVNVAGPSALKDVAGALASIAAPKGTSEWFDAYNFASQEEPARCGASGNDDFSRQYRRAFQHVRGKLTAGNLPTFYRGLCTAWADASARARSEAQQANAAREQVIARNLAAEAATSLRRSAAKVGRDAALGVALSAVFFFMVVALFLAFLAIEGHSHAIRQALAAIAKPHREGGSVEGT